MLKKTLLTFLGLFLIFNAWLWIKPRKMLAQYPRQAHMIQLEEYVYEKANIPVVVVGSSMAARLDTAHLGAGIHNLAVGGATIFEGLEVIRRSNGRPRLIVVETNTLFHGRRPVILKDLFRTGFFQVRRYLPGLREKYQPMGLIGRRTFRSIFVRLYHVFNRPSSSANNPSPAKPLVPAEKKPAASTNKPSEAKKAPVVGKSPAVPKPSGVPKAGQPNIAREILEHNLKEYGHPPAAERASRIIGELRLLLNELEGRGARIVFLEIPMHCSFEKTPQHIFARKSLARSFPPGRYLYWKAEECGRYTTTDGLHLDLVSGYKFSLRLREKILGVIK